MTIHYAVCHFPCVKTQPGQAVGVFKNAAHFFRQFFIRHVFMKAQVHHGAGFCQRVHRRGRKRVIAKHQEVSDEESALLATEIASRIQAEVDYPGKIKVTVIREMRARATAS